MNLKEYLEKRIRGWLPKELSLPRNQRTRMVDQFMRLQLLRLAYGVILGALLVTPFGAYHSRVEPYIIGYLWGYHLPIGYVGLLLGIAVVLYPRLNKLRSLRFSSFMPFIGLFLLLSIFFSPKYYFINLIHGTNFSPWQIDVDFPVGNSAVLGLSILSIVFGLVTFIRGWLPKERSLAYTYKASKPSWWRPLWIVTVLGIIVSGVFAFLIFHVPLERTILGLAFSFLCVGFAYYIRVRPSLKVNRVVYICLGFGVGWVMWLIYAFSGVGRLATDTIGVWPALIISDMVFYVAGALIGDWIGKRRNYQLPLSP
jgi:hypothetical protein